MSQFFDQSAQAVVTAPTWVQLLFFLGVLVPLLCLVAWLLMWAVDAVVRWVLVVWAKLSSHDRPR